MLSKFALISSIAAFEIPLELTPGVSRKDAEHRRLAQEIKDGLRENTLTNHTAPLTDEARRQLAIYNSDLQNYFNYQYIGKLWLGSHLQEMSFIFDTGSAWTWVPS